ncbi:hypothetical protein [Bacteroides sp. AM30-16]|uniref:hypothetical protein n=1 Tax=Bacteroides sp. AM30-16 TaxID=2292949 RepID=UPI001058E1C3|nr:hypothetical protein [Bacteroides sp. AM30-16]
MEHLMAPRILIILKAAGGLLSRMIVLSFSLVTLDIIPLDGGRIQTTNVAITYLSPSPVDVILGSWNTFWKSSSAIIVVCCGVSLHTARKGNIRKCITIVCFVMRIGNQ